MKTRFFLEDTGHVYRKNKKSLKYYDGENSRWTPIVLSERQIKKLIFLGYFIRITEEEAALLI